MTGTQSPLDISTKLHIPKGDGSKTRPIGIPTFEDKVLQRAVTMVLEAIYEQEFRNPGPDLPGSTHRQRTLEVCAGRELVVKRRGGHSPAPPGTAVALSQFVRPVTVR